MRRSGVAHDGICVRPSCEIEEVNLTPYELAGWKGLEKGMSTHPKGGARSPLWNVLAPPPYGLP
jgi:hypothetical protein